MDNASTTAIVSRSWTKNEWEYRQVVQNIEVYMQQPNTRLIAVVSPDVVQVVADYCREQRQGSWERLLSGRGWPARVVATSTNLERMIDGLCSNRQTTKMVILVSARIRKISFHVRLALGIQALKIVRCGVISNSSSSRPQPLMIEGRSRFNEVRFEDWGEESRDSCLVLGPNVYIGVDEDGESAWARRYRARTANALAVPTEDMQNQHAHDQTGGWSIFSAALCVGIGSAKFGLNMGVGYAG